MLAYGALNDRVAFVNVMCGCISKKNSAFTIPMGRSSKETGVRTVETDTNSET
jgi:hypothetical protein